MAMNAELEKIVNKNPRSLLFAQLADEYRKDGNFDKALPLCEQGVEKHPNYLPGLLVYARILLDIKQLQEAEEVYKKALAIDVSCLAAHRYIGESYAARNQKELAAHHAAYLRVFDSAGPAINIEGLSNSPSEIEAAVERVIQASKAPAGEADAVDEMSRALDSALLDDDEETEDYALSEIKGEDLSDALDSLFGGEDFAGSIAEESAVSAPSEASADNADNVESVTPEASDLSDALDAMFGSDDSDENDSFSLNEGDSDTSVLNDDEITESEAAVEEELTPDVENALDAMFDGADPFADEGPAKSVQKEVSTSDELFDNIFGSDDDDLPEEESSVSASASAENAADDALDDLFGSDDDLPTEESVVSDTQAEVSASDTTREMDAADTADDALDDLFGSDDDLPEEESSVSASTSVENAADDALDDLFGSDDDLPTEESVLSDSQPEVIASDTTREMDAADTADDALDDLFGSDDDLPEEESSVSASTSVENAADDALDDLFGSDDDLPTEESVVSDSQPEVIASEATTEMDAADTADDALDDLFGSDDDLPEEESSVSASTSVENAADDALDDLFGSDDDLPTEESVVSDSQPEVIASEATTEMDAADTADDALDDLFGSDDDLPEEESSVSASTSVENAADDALDDLFGSDDDLPTEESVVSDSQAEVSASEATREMDAADTADDALDDLFGSDDDLPEEESSVSASTSVENAADDALDDLFGSDDDLLEEESSVSASTSVENAADDALDDLFGSDDDDLPTEESVVSDSQAEVSVLEQKEESSVLDDLLDLDGESLEAGTADDGEVSITPVTNNAEEKEDAPSATVTLAEIYMDQELPEEALAMYKQLLEREPDNKKLQERIAEIEVIAEQKRKG
jgi:tetratricopeptide (TPR) repeat protein